MKVIFSIFLCAFVLVSCSKVEPELTDDQEIRTKLANYDWIGSCDEVAPGIYIQDTATFEYKENYSDSYVVSKVYNDNNCNSLIDESTLTAYYKLTTGAVLKETDQNFWIDTYEGVDTGVKTNSEIISFTLLVKDVNNPIVLDFFGDPSCNLPAIPVLNTEYSLNDCDSLASALGTSYSVGLIIDNETAETATFVRVNTLVQNPNTRPSLMNESDPDLTFYNSVE